MYRRFVLRNCDTGESFAYLPSGRDDTLFDAIDRADLPIVNACRGSMACGKCVVSVVEGAEKLVPPSDEELALIARHAPDVPDARLACQIELVPGETEATLCTAYWKRDAEGNPVKP
jgi:ferredoxin